MADKTIGELDPYGPAPADDDLLPIELADGSATKKVTVADLAGAPVFAGVGAVMSVNGETGTVVIDAGDVPVSPAGGIAATDVQAALEELDTEKASTGALAAYLALVAGGASVENIGAVESNVNTVATSGSTETLDTSLYNVHDVTMDQNCAFTFSNPAPSGKDTTFKLILRGAFTPSWVSTVIWPDATEPDYATPTVYVFWTVDGGTWFGSSAGKAFG